MTLAQMQRLIWAHIDSNAGLTAANTVCSWICGRRWPKALSLCVVFICVYTYAYIYTYGHRYASMHTYTYTYVYIYVYVYVRSYI